MHKKKMRMNLLPFAIARLAPRYPPNALLAAMGSAHADMWTSEVRANMLFFTEQCGDVLDEMYARYQSQMSV